MSSAPAYRLKWVFHMYVHGRLVFYSLFKTICSLNTKVKRSGDSNVRCTILLMLDYQPPQYKLDPCLARILGLHTGTRSQIFYALWNYIKVHR